MNPQENKAERKRLTELALDKANLEIKRFYALDHGAYEDGALEARTKEMLGLVASMVLRCDDCICYHLERCKKYNVSDAELQELMNVALVVGGTIVIPHHRRAVQYWEDLKETTTS